MKEGNPVVDVGGRKKAATVAVLSSSGIGCSEIEREVEGEPRRGVAFLPDYAGKSAAPVLVHF